MVPISLSRCWASALSKPALEYRRQHGIPIQSIRLAVLIQPYIQPAAAGVAFSINPLSGARDELVIEATFGHAGPLASGEITPARYHLTKRPPDYALLDWTPGDTAYMMSPVKTGHDVPLMGDDRGPLSESQLRRLAQYLEHIEALMGAPQDVEWALTGENLDEEILFFQSRPITGLTGDAVPFDVEWTRADIREFLPDLPSPLCASLLERTQAKALSFFERLGFSVDEVGPYLKIIYGRPYLNLTLARRLLAQSGLSPDGVLWVIGHAEFSAVKGPDHTIDWHQMWKSRQPIIRLLLRGLPVRAKLSRFKRLSDEVRSSLSATDWAKASPASLLARFRLRTQLGSQMAEADFELSAAAVATYSALAQTLGSVTDEVEQLAREAISKSITTSGARQGHSLLELARIAQADDQVRHYLSEPNRSFADYRQALAGTPFLADFDDFIAQHGRSATFEADPGWPRYGEDPSSLLTTVAHITEFEALPGQPGISDNAHDTGQLPGEEVQLRTSLKPARGLDKLRYRLASLVIKRLGRLTKMRAQLRMLYGESMSDCRSWDLKLAERWVARGWLTEPGDYFWLTMEEVERALMAEAEVGPTMPALVRARREVYQTYTATEMPYTMRESDVTRLVPGQGLMGTPLSSVLSGLPVSPGQVQGQVVVLHRPQDLAHMQEGAILVTPSTDTAWFPIFPMARGLIVETGGLLSHGSIITREFGLPAVANIPDATSRFHDGDLVLLDGSTGLVQILSTAPGLAS
jgi:pyruvate,water dikinase